MTMPLNYEYFIRMAFGFVATGEMLDRWEDPAGLANTDCFTSDNIAGVKAATGYALEIMSNSVINHLNTKLADAEMKRLENFTKQVIDAQDLLTIDRLITDYRNTVVDQYFNINQGKISLL